MRLGHKKAPTFAQREVRIANKLGFKAVEVPVDWTHVPGTRVRFATDAPRALADLMLIRYRDFTGAYS